MALPVPLPVSRTTNQLYLGRCYLYQFNRYKKKEPSGSSHAQHILYCKLVIVWLGGEMGDTEIASALFPNSEAALSRMLDNSNHRISLSQWRCLVDLPHRLYWRRVWIVQEFVIAKKISLWCGGLILDASGFERLYLELQNLQSYPLAVCSFVQMSPGWNF